MTEYLRAGEGKQKRDRGSKGGVAARSGDGRFGVTAAWRDGAVAKAADSLGYGQFMDVNVFATVARRSEEKAQKKG